jgi:putative flippase GtrA
MNRPKTSEQFTRFVLAGGVAALANFASRFAFSLAFDYAVAIVLAYGVGMLTAFLLMRRFVFHAHGRDLAAQAVKFILVNLLAVAQTLVVSLALARWVLPALGVDWQVEAIAHAIGVAVPVFTSFLLHRRATFA